MTGCTTPGNALLSFEALEEGVLIKRYKRFLADVELSSGEVITAHCANTGPMTGVLIPGQRVRLRHAPHPSASSPGPGSKPRCLAPMASPAGWASTQRSLTV